MFFSDVLPKGREVLWQLQLRDFDLTVGTVDDPGNGEMVSCFRFGSLKKRWGSIGSIRIIITQVARYIPFIYH